MKRKTFSCKLECSVTPACSSGTGGLGMKAFDSFGMTFQSLGLEHELIDVTFCKSGMSHISSDMGGTDGRYENNPLLVLFWVWFKNMFSLHLLS